MLESVPIALLIAGVLALYMAWAIGANDVANAMGTSVGSGALTITGAILVAGILEFAGAFLAGGHVTDTVRKGMLDMDAMTRDYLIYGMLAALASAATLLLGATRLGLPVSTTHSIIGAIIGFGAVAIGPDAVNWPKVGQIVLSWLTSPLLSGALAYVIFGITRSLILNKANPLAEVRRIGPFFFFYVFFIIGLVTLFKGLKHIDLDFTLGQSLAASTALGLVGAGLGTVLLRRAEAGPKDEGQRFSQTERVFVVLQILTACAVAFAHGSNDVANSIGPLAAIASAVQEGGEVVQKAPVQPWMLAIGGFGIVLGLGTWGYKVMCPHGSI